MRIYLQAAAFIVAFSAILTFFTFRYLNESQPNPCAAGGPAIKCYNITQKMCEHGWTKSESTCKEWLRKLNLPAGRLTGPIVRFCQQSMMDEIFHISRKSTAECKQSFEEIENWRRQNSPPSPNNLNRE